MGITMKKYKFFIGAVLLALTIFTAEYLNVYSSKLGLYMVTGLAIGYVMQRSRFGFAGTVRKLYSMGDGTLAKAVLFLLVLSLIGEAAIHYNASVNGLKIPAMGSVKTINMLTVIGGFLFGIGMMFAGGCASGTLTDLGEGYFRASIVLLFFCLGSVLGVAHLAIFQKTFLGVGTKIYLPAYIGYFAAITSFILFYILIYFLIKKYESYRQRKNTFTPETWAEHENPLVENSDSRYKIFSYKTYHHFFVERWSFYRGGVLISCLFLVILTTTGKNWGVSTEFAYWGAWLVEKFGVDIRTIPYFQTAKAVKILDQGFLMHPGSIRNVGIIFGTIIAALLAGDFVFKPKMNLRDILIFILGGLLMGYGARLGQGCNIGAFYSSLSAMSISGVVFGIALTIGGIVGLKLLNR
jgi:uncharacterized membrane protein YedE/YeeE